MASLFPRLHPHDCKHTWGSGRHLRQTEVRQRKPEGAADADQKPDLRTFLWNPFAASQGWSENTQLPVSGNRGCQAHLFLWSFQRTHFPSLWRWKEGCHSCVVNQNFSKESFQLSSTRFSQCSSFPSSLVTASRISKRLTGTLGTEERWVLSVLGWTFELGLFFLYVGWDFQMWKAAFGFLEYFVRRGTTLWSRIYIWTLSTSVFLSNLKIAFPFTYFIRALLMGSDLIRSKNIYLVFFSKQIMLMEINKYIK